MEIINKLPLYFLAQSMLFINIYWIKEKNTKIKLLLQWMNDSQMQNKDGMQPLMSSPALLALNCRVQFLFSSMSDSTGSQTSAAKKSHLRAFKHCFLRLRSPGSDLVCKGACSVGFLQAPQAILPHRRCWEPLLHTCSHSMCRKTTSQFV